VDLGERLRKARRRQALSLYEVSERTGLHFSTIAKYERGERRPDVEVLRELAAVYDVSLTELLGEEADALAAFPPSFRSAAGELLRRQELQSLLALGSRLRPEQVQGLVGFLRTLVTDIEDPLPPRTGQPR
jgi:transcriptional regulator with XRE-family HTH domain